jgi:NADH:ubiquinone oxidoreductase subunit K
MALMAVTITLEFSETKALYLFLFIRSMLFFVCAGGVWKRHRLIGFFMTNALLLGSLAFNFYLIQMDPVEMSRATGAMLAAFAGVILLHFIGYFRKMSGEGETTETPPAATDDKELPQAPPEASTEPEIEADDEPVAPEQNDVHHDETAKKEHGDENNEPT